MYLDDFSNFVNFSLIFFLFVFKTYGKKLIRIKSGINMKNKKKIENDVGKLGGKFYFSSCLTHILSKIYENRHKSTQKST